jgi:hypothetical protein
MQRIETTDDDVIMIVRTMMEVAEDVMAVEAVKVVGAEKVADMSIGTKTKVRPVSPVSSLT